MEEVLFEVTKEQLETGMRGYPVGYCTTSYVDPIKGLFYRGRPISELYKWEPERVIYLLHHGKEGSAQDISQFSQELKKRAHCSQCSIGRTEVRRAKYPHRPPSFHGQCSTPSRRARPQCPIEQSLPAPDQGRNGRIVRRLAISARFGRVFYVLLFAGQGSV